MNKVVSVFCDKTTTQFSDLILKLQKIIDTDSKQEYSEIFKQFIITYNLDQKNWQKQFTDKHSIQIINIITQLFDLWQQIQEDNLPFSYVKQKLSQKVFENQLLLIKTKIAKI